MALDLDPLTRRWLLEKSIKANSSMRGRLAGARGPLGDIRSYAAPTLTEALTGGAGRAVEALAQKFGLNERDAIRLGSHFTRSANNLDDLAFGARSLENSAEDIGSGRGQGGDYANLGLHALPFVGGPAARLAVRGASAVAPRTVARVADWAGAGPEYVMRGGNRVYHAPEGVTERGFAVDAPQALPAPQGRLTDQSPLAVPVGDPYTPRSAFHPAPGPLSLADQSPPPLPPGAVRHVDARGRGVGEWWPNTEIDDWNYSPEAVAKNEGDRLVERFRVPPEAGAWLGKALTKYLKTSAFTPNDPLLPQIAAGNSYRSGMTPEKWERIGRRVLGSNTLADTLVPEFGQPKGVLNYLDPDVSGGALGAKAPWLLQKPATDPLYHANVNPLDIPSFNDGLMGLLGLQGHAPPHLQIGLENLQNRTFPEVSQRIGQLRDWRTAEVERRRAEREAWEEAEQQRQRAVATGPAVVPYRDYPGDPNGMKWMEIKRPEGVAVREGKQADISGYDLAPWEGMYAVNDPEGAYLGSADDLAEAQAMAREHATRHAPADYADLGEATVRDAMGAEGKLLNTCIGDPDQPYCNDVLQGNGRAFSLRDAQGKPHMTIFTQKNHPVISGELLDKYEPGLWDHIVAENGHWDTHNWLLKNRPELYSKLTDLPDDIQQIKGNYNSPAKPEYRPYVQDFVRHQPWDFVGDVGNAHLVKLPNGQFMDADQYNGILDKTGISNQQLGAVFNPGSHSGGHDNTIRPRALRDWPDIAHHFDPSVAPPANPAPRHSPQEIEALADELGGIDWEPDPAHGANFADGGPVRAPVIRLADPVRAPVIRIA